jgi:hypothetical protein
VENEECGELERSGPSPRWRNLSMVADLVRPFDCFDYLVGFNVFVHVKAQSVPLRT